MAVYRFTGVRRVDREPNHVCIHSTIAPYVPWATTDNAMV